MTLFFVSGNTGLSEDLLIKQQRIIQNRLLSVHGSYMRYTTAWITGMQSLGWHPNALLLDSGAFTAWNKGEHTTVDQVSRAYNKIHELTRGKFDNIWVINLDVIPGERGRTPTEDEISAAVDASDKNLLVLQREFGNRVLPVFHQGESDQRLNEVKAQAYFICISPRNDVAEKFRVQWAHEIHAAMGTNNATHGLATTGTKMLRVPWYSVDSATATHLAAFGTILVCRQGILKTFSLSATSERLKDIDQHYTTLDTTTRDEITAIIEQDDNVTLQELSNEFNSRMLFNIRQLAKAVEHAKKDQRISDQITLFGI